MTTILLIFLSLKGYCQHQETKYVENDANKHMHQNSHEQLAKIFDSSARDEWQKPEEVIKYLGNIKGQSIVDVGSGSGYFTFRLAASGALVIAADIDQEFLDMIEEKRSKLNFDVEQVKTKQISEKELNIESNSADIVLLVNVYHHITNRVDYFRRANSVLKKTGKIVIVDFYKKDLPVGPPKHHKISKEKILDELSVAGYKRLDINTELLDYQYIITAYKF